MKVHQHRVEQQKEQQSASMIALDSEFPKDSSKLQPLTIVAKHRVREDHSEIFILWCREMSALARDFRGYLSSEVIKPLSPDSEEYITIFRFGNYAHLQVWMHSKERAGMYERVDEFSDHASIYSFHFLEHWFPSDDVTPKEKGGGPPRKYKMVLVTTTIIYSQNLWVPKVMLLLAPNMNWYARGFLNTFFIVIIAAYMLFPVVTRLLAFWLVPGAVYTDVLRELVPSWCVFKSRSRQSEEEAETDDSDTGVVGAVVNVDSEEKANSQELPV